MKNNLFALTIILLFAQYDLAYADVCSDQGLTAAMQPEIQQADRAKSQGGVCMSAKAMNTIALRALELTASCSSTTTGIRELRSEMEKLKSETQRTMDGSCG